MNLASAQARHKEDVTELEANLQQSQARATALEQEIASKDDIIKRTEQEFPAFKKVVHKKHTEVYNFAEHLNILKILRHCPNFTLYRCFVCNAA